MSTLPKSGVSALISPDSADLDAALTFLLETIPMLASLSRALLVSAALAVGSVAIAASAAAQDDKVIDVRAVRPPTGRWPGGSTSTGTTPE